MKRQYHSNPSAIRTLRCALAASMLAIAMNVSAGEGSAVTITANSLSATATVSQTGSIELRVAGPGGFRASRQSETGALDWYPAGLADGEYRYEVFVTVGDKPAEGDVDTTRLYRENGRFKVENGTIMPLEEAGTPPLPDFEDQGGIDSSPWYEKLATGILDFLVPPAAAANLVTNPGDVYISDPTPYIYWDDTDASGTEWTTWGRSDSFGIWDYANSKHVIRAEANSAFSIYETTISFNVYNHNASGYAIYVDTNAGLDVLHAYSTGDIELADGLVYIDKSTGFLGVGTMAPADDIHITSTSPAVLLDSTSGGDIKIENASGELSFYRSNGNYNGYALTLENDLTTSLYPGVGIWNSNPTVPLHVGSHDDMSAGLLVQNSDAPTAAGDVTMFRLENTGDKIVRFAIEAGGASSIWTFDNEPTYNSGAGVNSGRFRIAKSGTGVAEFTVDGYGHGRFYGNSYAVNHVNTSSRDSKTDFVVLNEQDILNRLMQLPVSEWRYKQEHQESRHIGPVAEDFQQAFGLGDGKHISTVDSEGVALAAIKAVKSEKDAEIAALKVERDTKLAALRAEKDTEIAELEAELAALREEKGTELTMLMKQNKELAERLSALEELLLNQQPVSAR